MHHEGLKCSSYCYDNTNVFTEKRAHLPTTCMMTSTSTNTQHVSVSTVNVSVNTEESQIQPTQASTTLITVETGSVCS